MTFPADPGDRQPKGDHNRRLSLGLDPDQFAAAAGLSVEALRAYEATQPDHDFDPAVAQQVGEALERLEAVLPNSEAAGVSLDNKTSREDVLAEAEFEQSVRDTAYYLWEAEGRPDGRDQEYWHRAHEAHRGQQDLDRDFAAAVTESDSERIDRAVETARRIGLQRPFKKGSEDTTSGGFNQKR